MNGLRLLLVPILALLYVAVSLPVVRLGLAFAAVFIALSWGLSQYQRRHLVVKALKVKLRVFPGQEAEIGLQIANTGWLPSGPLTVADSTGGLEVMGRSRSLFEIQRRRVHEVRYRVIGRERGLHRLGPVEIRGRDPAGLFPWRVNWEEERTVLVYPRPPAMTGFGHKGPGPGALKRALGWETDPTRFSHLRDYDPGDSLRQIDPATSARFGRLLTKQYEVTRDGAASLWLQLHADGYPVRNRYNFLERAVDTAAAVVMEFFQQRERLGLKLNGGLAISPGVGAEVSLSLMEALALCQPTEVDGWARDQDWLVFPGTRHLIYIGPPPSEAVEEALVYHETRGCRNSLLLVGTSGVLYPARKGRVAARVGDYGDVVLGLL